MKNTMKKILAVALVLMMTLPLVAFPISADEAIEPIFEVDFRSGDKWNGTPQEAWSGFSGVVTRSAKDSEGKSIDLKFSAKRSQASVFGHALNENDYEMSGSAFTTVFTVTAEDADQEVGFFPDWQSGFVVKPGKNSYRYVEVLKDSNNNRTNVNEVLASQSYGDENGELTQTYAIEVKDEGTARGSYNITVYNLYVAIDGEWELICSLDTQPGIAEAFNWSSVDYEYVLRFFRNGMDETQVGKSLVVSDCAVYEGLVATNLEIPHIHAFAFVENKAPTCTEDGYDLYRCECGEEEERNEVSALGHDFANKETIKEPTCTEDGEEAIGVCTRCGTSVGTQAIPAIGHDWDEGVVTTAPTLEVDGVLTKTCKNDATHTTTEVIPKQPSDGDLLYEVKFEGDDVFKPGSSWSGASVKIDKEANTATISTKKDSTGTNYRGSAWGADLKGYNLLGNSYTVVFTLEASDLNQEIGFMPCDHAGFVVTPGNNQYRFITTRFNDNGTDGAYEKVIASGEYQTTERSLKQTFAVELKTSGTKEEPIIDAYNLYVLDGTEWKLVCALDSVNDELELTDFDWFYWEDDVYEEDLTMRFYRRCYALDENGFTTDVLDELQGGTVTVSDAKL